MSQVRFLHMAVKLRNGTVLVIGGGSTASIDAQRSVERFDPTDKSWRLVESMIKPHMRGVATLLDDGTVLVAGGAEYGPERDNPSETLLPYSERFDPLSGHWGEWALLNSSPLMPAAAALKDTTVLVTGGRNAGKNVVRYNRAFLLPNTSPQPKVWQIMATLREARSNHRATLLPSGDVLVTGGYVSCGPQSCGGSLRSAEQYNPTANAWTTIDNMFFFRGDHTATLLGDGSVLVVGGFNWSSGSATASAESYTP
jgi:hypothetical protein